MGTTFTCVATGDWNDDATWGLTDGDYPGNGGATDDVVIMDIANKSGGPGDLTVTLVADVELKAIKMAGTASGDATLHTASEHTLTLNDTEFSGYSAHVTGQTEFTGNVNFTFTKSGTTHIIIDPASQTNKLNDITCNHSSLALHLLSAITIKGDLNCTLGSFSTQSSGGGTSHALTVTGTTTIGPASGVADQATLTCNGSDVTLGSGRQQADYALNIEIGGTFVGGTATHTVGSLYMAQSANAKATMTTAVMTINGYNNSANKAWRVEYGGDTFDNNNGTVKFHLNGFNTRMSMRGASHANNAFHNLIIDADTSARQISPDNGSKIIVDNDLTITNGKLVMGMSHALEVGGDVEIDDASGTAILEMGSSSNISSQAATFGSLTIGGSGTYKATSGTTTITDEGDGSGGTAGYAWYNLGTFTHNNGTVKVTTASNTHLRENTFYNLTINSNGQNIFLRPNSGTTISMVNNFTLIAGIVSKNTHTHTVTVTGLCNVGDGSGSADTAHLDTSTSGTATSNFGTLVILSDGKYTQPTTTNVSSIRNVGGTIA